MVEMKAKKSLLVVLAALLIAGPQPILQGAQATEPQATSTSGGATDAAPLTANEIQPLIAPIALYPDQLVAQILSGATFPNQIALAQNWVVQHPGVKGKDLVKAVNAESWDSSVKALTAFPSVLANMAKNLSWTSSLGEAYHNQPAAVMEAVQTLRAQARSAGHLQSTPQITVTESSPQTIVIQPANPQIVYVPVYNPYVIYGVPYAVPGYTAGDVAAAAVIGFGAGIAVGAMMDSAWGWSTWGCDWHGGVVVYNHSAFYGNAAWHGAYYHGDYHAGAYGYHGTYSSRTDINRSVNVNRPSTFNSNSWAHNSAHTSAFSNSGFASRADSGRGWGSMHSGGFSGGRFSGGHVGGGGFRR
jgi:hypothetical protein